MRANTNHAMAGNTKQTPPQRKRIERGRRQRRALVSSFTAVVMLVCALLTVHIPVSSKPGESSGVVSEQGEAWMLVLVNGEHPMDPYQPELTHLRDGQAVDSRCYPDLQRMFDAMRAEGLSPKVNSSWRSRDEQQRVLDDAVAAGVAEGLSEKKARRQALRTVAEPGTSEHETGLAIDVTSESQTGTDNTAVWGWMANHSWEYGWILRYPASKTAITGIDNEPWHFRYVGARAAHEMHDTGQCLEEYLGQR